LDKNWDWGSLYKILYNSLEVEYGRKHMSSFLIQNRWKNICVDPTDPIGKQVIRRRFEQIRE